MTEKKKVKKAGEEELKTIEVIEMTEKKQEVKKQEDTVKQDESTATKKQDDNLMAAIAYPLGFITGLIVYIMYKEKGNKFVLFHAIQSTISSVILTVIMIPLAIFLMLIGIVIPAIGCLLDLIILIPVAIASLAFLAFMMYKAYNGEKFKIPVVGEMAEKYV